MGRPVDFVGTNKTFVAAPGTEDEVGTIKVFDNGKHIVEAWELRPDELAEIQRTGVVYLSILSRGLPPVFVGSRETVRELIADAGVWRSAARGQCQNDLRLQGKPYPRTCQVCGLGPCIFHMNKPAIPPALDPDYYRGMNLDALLEHEKSLIEQHRGARWHQNLSPVQVETALIIVRGAILMTRRLTENADDTRPIETKESKT